MWNPFDGKTPEDGPDIDFHLLNGIFEHLTTQNGYIAAKVKNQPGLLEVYWYHIPASCAAEESWLKKNNFKNFYELVNVISARSGIGALDIPSALAEDLQINLMEISFSGYPQPQEKNMLKLVRNSFFFIFVAEPEQDELGGFRSYYIRNNYDAAVASFYQAEYIPDINHPGVYEDAVRQLEYNLAALAVLAGLPLSDKLTRKYPGELLHGPVTAEDFKRIIQLVNFHEFNGDAGQKATELLEAFHTDWPRLYERLYDFRPDEVSYFPLHTDIIHADANLWDNDWKFDAEEIEYVISSLLQEEWRFDHPEDMYSHDLFPFIQAALSQKGWELMSFDTEADSYLFFIVHKEHVPEILELSNKLSLGIEIL